MLKSIKNLFSQPKKNINVIEMVDWYTFDHDHQMGEKDLKGYLGGKGAGLAEMTRLGIPVPPGFTIPTTVCLEYLESGWTLQMGNAVKSGVQSIETALGRRLGDPTAPLLLSVRSGAAQSMPGMMDTVLNAGITEDVARGLAKLTGDPNFAWDTYRRAITSFAQIVLGAPTEAFARFEKLSDGPNAETSAIAFGAALAAAGYEIPADPIAQIEAAVRAVFQSWHTDRAKAYRERQGIDHGLGTAATVQAMAFGNLGEKSGTGVAFSRDPATGAAGLMGDFLVAAQGEDVVAGTHKTMPLHELENRWPQVWQELSQVSNRLEQRYADMVDLEFTVEQGKLWLLQTRVAKRSPVATFRAAVEMAEDPDFPVDRDEAVERCRDLFDNPPVITNDPDKENDETEVLATGLAASPGLAVGVLSLDPDDAVARQERGERVILVRQETSPNDIHGMGASVGLVTTLGGMVSHAAVVARAWGLAAVVGCKGLELRPDALISGDHRIEPGTTISVCGNTGRLFLGARQAATRPLPEVEKIKSWAREMEQVAGGELVKSAGSELEWDVAPNACLRLVVLKGMTTAEGLVEPLGTTAESIQSQLDQLGEQGLISPLKGGRVRATKEGQAAIAKLFEDEKSIAMVACDTALHPFHEPNLKLKEVVTAWQVRDVAGAQQPNDHTDTAYDRAVINRLRDEVHAEIGPILSTVAVQLPRLERYQHRLDAALEKLSDGDNRYMAHPFLDSYHTVWFELHEELIRLAGRTRKAEAEAGRA